MNKVDYVISLHDAGTINIIDNTVKSVLGKVDASKATIFEARKRIKERDGIKPKKPLYQIVLDAHKEGKIDLKWDMYVEIAELMGVHNDVVRAAVKKGNIKRAVKVKRGAANAAYWAALKPQLRLMSKWGVIPERIGLTKNEWRKRCASI